MASWRALKDPDGHENDQHRGHGHRFVDQLFAPARTLGPAATGLGSATCGLVEGFHFRFLSTAASCVSRYVNLKNRLIAGLVLPI